LRAMRRPCSAAMRSVAHHREDRAKMPFVLLIHREGAMPRQGEAPNRRSQAHLVLLCTGGVPVPTGASLRSLVRGNMHAGFWSRGGQSDLSIDCNWSLLRSWLRPHRGISQEKLPLYLGFFEFVHNVRKRGKALLPALIELLVT